MIWALAEAAAESEADASLECIVCSTDLEAPALGGSGLLAEAGEAEARIEEVVLPLPDSAEPALASTPPEDLGALPTTPLWKGLHLWDKWPLAQP